MLHYRFVTRTEPNTPDHCYLGLRKSPKCKHATLFMLETKTPKTSWHPFKKPHQFIRIEKKCVHLEGSTLKQHLAAVPAGHLQSAHVTQTAAPWKQRPATTPASQLHHSHKSTLKQHPAAAAASPASQLETRAPGEQQHPQAAPCSGTLQRHPAAASCSDHPSSITEEQCAASAPCSGTAAPSTSTLKQHPPPAPAPKRR